MIVAISISPSGRRHDLRTIQPIPYPIPELASPRRGRRWRQRCGRRDRPGHPRVGAAQRDQRDVHQHRGRVGRGDGRGQAGGRRRRQRATRAWAWSSRPTSGRGTTASWPPRSSGSRSTCVTAEPRVRPETRRTIRSPRSSAPPSPTRATHVAALWAEIAASDLLLGSLVAEVDGEVVGHVGLSHAWVDARRELVDVWVLSPLSVVPERQGAGVGTRLARGGRRRGPAGGAPLLFLEGDPGFYGARGFERADRARLRAGHDPDARPGVPGGSLRRRTRTG